MPTPSCEICGSPVVGSTDTSLCADCTGKYDVRECASCGARIIRGRADLQEPTTCSACVARAIVAELPAAVLADLDAFIFSGQKVRGIAFISSQLGCPLHRALEAFTARYDALRAAEPDRFQCSHDEYWRGFYS